MDKPDYKDEKLIELFLKSNDEKYFNYLILKYLKYIYNFVRQYIENKQTAEDLTQEIFFKVWKSLFSFDTKKSFKPYLFQIARNTIFDYLRKKKSLNFSDLSDENFIQSLQIKNKSELNTEIIIEKALQKIPTLYKEILYLRYYSELTFKEIGEILKIPENTARSYHRRALKLLQKIIND